MYVPSTPAKRLHENTVVGVLTNEVFQFPIQKDSFRTFDQNLLWSKVTSGTYDKISFVYTRSRDDIHDAYLSAIIPLFHNPDYLISL